MLLHGDPNVAPEDGWLPGAFNQGWSYHDRVGPDADGLGVIAYYSARYRHSSASQWSQRLENGEVSLDGTELQHDQALRSGDRLLWRRPPWWEGSVPATLTTRFDDGDLLVIDKPAGLPVLPAGGWLEHTALRLLERRHRGDPGGIPRPVHRLGRFTSGLLVCARQPASRAWLSAQLRDSTAQLLPSVAAQAGWGSEAALPQQPPVPLKGQSVRDSPGRGPCSGPAAFAAPGPFGCGPERAGEPGSRQECGLAAAAWAGTSKVYRALLEPRGLDLAPGASLAIRVPIGRHCHPQLGQVWAAGGEDALPALSRLTLLESRPDGDLVEVAIQSGRPHQIRIHCAALGAPLLGDPLYRPGGLPRAESLPGDGGYRLHALALRLSRPQGGVLALWAPPPASLLRRGEDPPAVTRR